MTPKKRHIRKNRSKSATSARRLQWRRAISRILAVIAAAITIPMAALGCILTHDLITQGSFAKIDRVVISGTDRLSRQDIIRQAAIPAALNLLGVNLRVVRERLMVHPWIAEASVARQFPDHLIIHIREQQPTAQVAIDDQWYLANADGDIFAVREESQPDVPKITGMTYADLDADGRLPAVVWQAVLAATRHYAASLESAVRLITYDRNIGVSVQAAQRFGAIRLGMPPTANAFALADRVAAFLSSSGRGNRFAAIDMSNPNRVVVAPSPVAEGREEIHEESKHAV